MWQPAKISQVPGAENQHLGEKSDISKPREAFRITQVSQWLSDYNPQKKTHLHLGSVHTFFCLCL